MEVSDQLRVPLALFPEKLLLQLYKYEAKWSSEPVSKFWKKKLFFQRRKQTTITRLHHP